MVDKSWGDATSVGFRIRTNMTPEQRAADRAQARTARAQDRAGLAIQRTEDRAKDRAAAAEARELARVERRAREIPNASGDPHAAAAQRHRPSGRKDVVREQRDTRGYATVVDVGRMRELAKRGASVSGLAGAFGITEAQVRETLDDSEVASG